MFIFQLDEPQLGAAVEKESSSQYSSVSYGGNDYKLGDCAYFSPTSFEFSVKVPTAPKKVKSDTNDVRTCCRKFSVGGFVCLELMRLTRTWHWFLFILFISKLGKRVRSVYSVYWLFY